MIKIEKTSIIGRYNLVDTKEVDEDRYIRQLSTKEIKELAKSIINIIRD